MLHAYGCSSVSNGIARLIMEFAFGSNTRLIGMPREGADHDDNDEFSDEDIDEESNMDSDEEDTVNLLQT
jgi:hypothetical protein